jgi:hypothetical protein
MQGARTSSVRGNIDQLGHFQRKIGGTNHTAVAKRRSAGKRLAFCLGSAASLALTAAGWAAAPQPMLGSTTFTPGLTTGPSPDKNNNLYSLDIYYFDNTGTLAKATVKVPNIPVTAGQPNPTPAQVSAASAAKAQAIVAAINAANLNGVTAMTNNTVPGDKYPTGNVVPQMVVDPRTGKMVTINVPEYAAASLTPYTVAGVRQAVINPGTNQRLGQAIYRTPGNRVTGENGNQSSDFIQGGGIKSMYQGSLNGSGSNSGLVSTGLDASGNQSIIGFGFVDEDTPTPTYYIASMAPPSGLADADVLADLSGLFDADYSADGYTATYNSSTDSLSIDQTLPPEDTLWDSDSDTGLDFTTQMISVPEPTSASLLAIGGAALLTRRRRKHERGNGDMPIAH